MGSHSDNFRQKTIAGVSWSLVSRIASQVLRFVIGIILARLLTPNAYGLIGMVVVFTGFAKIFIDMGFGSALIQKRDTTPAHYDAIFWLNTGVGLLLTGVFVAAAPLVAQFYDEALLRPVTMLIAANFFVGSLGIIQRSRLMKAMAFKRLAVVDLVSLVVSGGVGVAMALTGWGVWSLAAQSVLMTFGKTVLYWTMSGWRPRFRFSRAAVMDLFGFSANLLGFKSLNYWFRNADNLLIGRFLSSGALGIYANSYKIMLLPVRQIASTIGRVMFPAFSTIQQDKARVARVYLRVTRAIALITFPLMAGMIAVADNFVLGVLGEQWRGMIPVLRLLCAVGALQSILTLNGNLYQSQGRTDLQLRVDGFIAAIGVGAIAVGLPWGVVGVATSYTVYALLVTYPNVRVPIGLVGLRFREVVDNLKYVGGVSVVMGVFVWGAGQALPGFWTHVARLGVQVLLGVVFYLTVIHLFGLKAYHDLRSLLEDQWQRRFGAKA